MMVERSPDVTKEIDSSHELLRHTLATLAYRGGKAVRDVGADFPSFRVAEHGRTPLEILAHIGDLMAWALSIAVGKETWNNATPQAWDQEVERFFNALNKFDQCLASAEKAETLAATPQALFQGPIADALTHVGQLAMLRRLAGTPMRGENYFQADIAAGKVGADQSPARFEF
jgi:hypothetical protein